MTRTQAHLCGSPTDASKAAELAENMDLGPNSFERVAVAHSPHGGPELFARGVKE